MGSIQILPPRRVTRQAGRPEAGVKAPEPPKATIIAEAAPATVERNEYRGIPELLARLAAVGLFTVSSLIWFRRWYHGGQTLALVLFVILALLAAMCVQRVFSYLLDSNE